ncbi:PiggyBac transposable element-derived protein 3 [Eumeta japonica]|uniref:PiggyBac transposable element-derived protein 3 n=1 Tax=Eumeta variegata TaxID=151549 RepID=A0A4C1UVW2_EUMVA|nr:PiggyBac transposable element-derived protein 3 [Eumeta japonica]
MSSRRNLNVHEMISALEDDNLTISADIFITPPENDDLSDEDSGSEDAVEISNLGRRQLLPEAEVRRTVSSLEGILENVEGIDQEEEEEQPTTSEAIEPSVKKAKIMVTRKWRHTDISAKPEKETTTPKFVLDKDNPLEFFEMFFDDQVLELLRSSTEKNAIAKGHVNFRLTIEEVKNFIGVLLLSGYNSVSRYRMYWDQSIDTHHSGVASCMTRNRFEELLRFFHACDNSSLPPDNKFGKVRPLWDMMNERWLKFFPGDKHLSIDESTVPYFGKHGTKQHIHGKPIRFGYKIWSLCTRLGYLIYGEPYQGAKTGNTNPNLGVGGSVVTNLISKLPTAAHYSFYTDNFFTSLQLLDDVSQMGHDITGTLWANRTEGAPLKDIKEMKKTARGSFHQITDVSLNSTLVRYNDNNIVTIASTESGVQPIGKLGISASKLKMPHDGYIYVATSDYYRENNLFKVGSTVNLDERIRQLNTGRTADDSLYYCDTWEVSHWAVIPSDVRWSSPMFRVRLSLLVLAVRIDSDLVDICFSPEKESAFNMPRMPHVSKGSQHPI